MSDVDPARLDRWLKALATTQEEELDCDALWRPRARTCARSYRGSPSTWTTVRTAATSMRR